MKGPQVKEAGSLVLQPQRNGFCQQPEWSWTQSLELTAQPHQTFFVFILKLLQIHRKFQRQCRGVLRAFLPASSMVTSYVTTVQESVVSEMRVWGLHFPFELYRNITYTLIHSFKMYSSMLLESSPPLPRGCANITTLLGQNIFITHKKKPILTEWSFPSLPPSSPWQPWIFFFFSLSAGWPVGARKALPCCPARNCLLLMNYNVSVILELQICRWWLQSWN